MTAPLGITTTGFIDDDGCQFACCLGHNAQQVDVLCSLSALPSRCAQLGITSNSTAPARLARTIAPPNHKTERKTMIRTGASSGTDKASAEASTRTVNKVIGTSHRVIEKLLTRLDVHLRHDRRCGCQQASLEHAAQTARIDLQVQKTQWSVKRCGGSSMDPASISTRSSQSSLTSTIVAAI